VAAPERVTSPGVVTSGAERRAAMLATRPDDLKPRMTPLAKLETRAAELEAEAADAELEAAKPSPAEAAKLARAEAEQALAEIEAQQADALEVVIRENAEAADLNATTMAALAAFIDAHETALIHHETKLAPSFRRARGLEVAGLPVPSSPNAPRRAKVTDPLKFNEMLNTAVALIRKAQW
jgi:hypothetical protein